MTLLDFIDKISESDDRFTSLPICLAENKMAVVFPSINLSETSRISRNKNAFNQKNGDLFVENSESVSKISRNIIAVKESHLTDVEESNPADASHLKVNSRQSIHDNNESHLEIGSDSYIYERQNNLDSVKEKYSMAVANSEACFEKGKVDAFGTSIEGVWDVLENGRLISVISGKHILAKDNCGKFGEDSAHSFTPTTESSESRQESSKLDHHSRTQLGSVITSPDEASFTASDDAPSTFHNGDILCKSKEAQSSPPSGVAKGSSSPVDAQLFSDKDTEPTLQILPGSSLAAFTKYDENITTEMTSQTLQTGKVTEQLPIVKDGSGEGRQRWSTRLSKSFSYFFQKHSSSTSGPTESEGQGRHARVPSKKSREKTTFAAKLMTSVAEWRRKPPNRSKSFPLEGSKNDSEVDDKKGEDDSDKGRVPIFVLPENQVEIVEEAPEGMREAHKRIIRQSWMMIKADVTEVGVETFMGLFHTHPDSIESFLAFKDKSVNDLEKSAVLKAHALRVMQTVDKCVSRLDEGDKMATILCQLGKRHIGYQANASLIPMIGQQFIFAIKPKLGDMWSDEVSLAWETLFRMINYNLRRGMMMEKHRLSDEAITRRKK